MDSHYQNSAFSSNYLVDFRLRSIKKEWYILSSMPEYFNVDNSSETVGKESCKILLISNNDDEMLILSTQLNLPQQQFIQIQYSQFITQFEHLYKDFSPDLIIIDFDTVTQMEIEQGMKMLKLHFHVPLLGISLTHNFNLTEKVTQFIDDLLLKPYTAAELYFRVKMLLGLFDQDTGHENIFPLIENRNKIDRRQLPQSNNDTNYSLIRIDGNGKRIYLNNVDMKLGPIAYKLFYLLINKTGEVVSIEEISASLWPDCNKNKENEIRVYINRLRSDIEKFPHHPCWIETVKNIGYRFILDKHCM